MTELCSSNFGLFESAQTLRLFVSCRAHPQSMRAVRSVFCSLHESHSVVAPSPGRTSASSRASPARFLPHCQAYGGRKIIPVLRGLISFPDIQGCIPTLDGGECIRRGTSDGVNRRTVYKRSGFVSRRVAVFVWLCSSAGGLRPGGGEQRESNRGWRVQGRNVFNLIAESHLCAQFTAEQARLVAAFP